jgi:hypothetical protein
MPVPVLKHLRQFVIATIFLIAASAAAQQAPHHFTKKDYETALNNGLYEEAGVAAKARLDQAIRDGKVKDFSTVELLDDLADVQRLSGDFVTAIQNYELAVEIVEDKRDMLDIALTEPLLGLGKSYLESGRADLALDYLDRALHIRSVNEGPHSIEQAEAIEVLADAYRTMGKPAKASDAADRLQLLYERKYSPDGLELIPVLLKKGHILGDLRDYRRQRSAYNDALDIAQKQESKQSAQAVLPLVSLGNSHSREYFEFYASALDEEDLPDERLLDEAETFYEAALEIVKNSPDIDWRIQKDSLLAIADFYTMTNEQSRARVLYRTVWDLLSGNDAQLMQRKQQLEQVTPLLQSEPDLTVAIPADVDVEDASVELKTGNIVIQFTVTRRGKLRDIGLIEINPERNDRIESEVKRTLNGFIYRPRFERGSAVDTVGLLTRYEFPYPESLPVTQ